MTTQWRLRGLDFIVACELAGRDTLPYPLRFVPPRMCAAEFRSHKRAAQLRVQALEPEFFTALRVLAGPDFRTAADGVANRERVRLYVAEAGGFTASARQLPGETDLTGGDVIIQLGGGTSIDLGGLGAGPRPPIHALATSSTVERFLSGAVSTGEISIGVGTRGGWLGSFTWLDCSDGRYLAVSSGQWTTISPASVSATAHELMKMRRTDPAQPALIHSHR